MLLSILLCLVGVNAGLGDGSSLDDFSPSVGALRVAFSSVHGKPSYTRCCNVAVYLLVGDVVEVTVVLNCCGFAARFGALEPELKLQDVRLGAAG